MAQEVKDLALALQRLELLLWCRFSPGPGIFHMLQVQPKKKKNINNNNKAKLSAQVIYISYLGKKMHLLHMKQLANGTRLYIILANSTKLYIIWYRIAWLGV